MSRRPLRPDERRDWARVASTVSPLPGRRAPAADDVGVVTPPADKPAPRGHSVSAPDPGAARKTAPPPPAERGGERRVRRGQVEVEARLDLHGMTQMQARAALRGFLFQARETGRRAVLVITGKGAPDARAGFGPDAPGVLRRRLPDWLAETDVRPFIAGYAPAHARHGGAGAWYVFLKRR